MSSTDIQELQSYLSSLEETLQQREKELQLTASYGKALLEENEKINKEIEAIHNNSNKGKNVHSKHNIEELNGMIEDSLRKLQAIEKVHESLQNDVTLKDNEISLLNQKILEAEKIIKDFNLQISVAKDTLNDLRRYQDSTSDLNKELEKVRENLNQLKLTLEEQEQTIHDLESKISNKNSQDNILPSKQESVDSKHDELLLENENLTQILKSKKDKLSSLEQFIKEHENNNNENEEEELILKIKQLKEENDLLNRQIEMKDNAIRQSKQSRLQNSQSPDFATYRKNKTSLKDLIANTKLEQPSSPNSSSTSITNIYNTTTDEESKLLLKSQQDNIEVLQKSLAGTESLLKTKQDEILTQITSLRDSMKSISSKKKTVSVKKEGYLVKQGKIVKNWKKRYFFLTNNILYYSRTKETRFTILGHIDLADASIKTNRIPTLPNLISIITPSRTWYLRAESELDMLEWIEALEACQEAESHSDEKN